MAKCRGSCGELGNMGRKHGTYTKVGATAIVGVQDINKANGWAQWVRSDYEVWRAGCESAGWSSVGVGVDWCE